MAKKKNVHFISVLLIKRAVGALGFNSKISLPAGYDSCDGCTRLISHELYACVSLNSYMVFYIIFAVCSKRILYT